MKPLCNPSRPSHQSPQPLHSFMWIATLVLGLGMLAVPERSMAARPIGIDVSDYQSASINWVTLKNTYGISFGWAKISEGTASGSGSGGGNFTTYAANAKAAGVLIGAYHYARYDLHTGTAGATSEANVFWAAAKNYITGGGYYIQPMLDVEASFTGYTKTTLSQWVNQWCITVSNSAAAAGIRGIKPCIYCSSSHASAYLDSTVTQWNSDIADWPYAHSTAAASAQAASVPPAGIAPWSTWQFWQYDDQNVAEAYTTGDGDIFNGTLAQLVSTMVIGGTPPAITTQPASQTLLAGANATFTVGASGTTPLSYQWRLNGGNISGASLSSYIKNNVQSANAGSYSVLVTNAYGSTNSAIAVLTVHTPPSIPGQPTNVTALPGSSVTLSVTATGDAPLSYQWSRNGGSLTGATSTALTIASAQATNAGTYMVVVTNLYGTATSASALLTVLDPGITNQPQSQTVAAGAPATFTVGAVGTAPLTYTWSMNGVALADGGNVSGSGTSTLMLANVQVGDVGTYSVTVSNLNGWVVSSNAILIAPFAPVVTTQPASQRVLAASTVSLAVAVIGPEPLTYQWQENGTNLADGGDLSGATTASLSISNVQAGDMGNYSVVVSNAYGPVTSSNALVSLWPLLGWGLNKYGTVVYGQADVPGGLSNVLAVAAGSYHSLALKGDGTVAAWGAGLTNSGLTPNYAQALVPAGLSNVVALSAGGYHSLALKADGTVAAWGAGTTNSGVGLNLGQALVPPGLSNVVAISGGADHSLALKADGTVVAWGAGTTNSGFIPDCGQSLTPAGLSSVVVVSAGAFHNLALQGNGIVVAWGAGLTNAEVSPDYGQSLVPSGLSNVVAVAAGYYHSLALQADGTVVAWGAGTVNTGLNPDYGQSQVPAGLSNVVAIAAGVYSSLALLCDGTVVAWGAGTTNTGANPNYGQGVVPAALSNAVAVAAGRYHTLALEGDGRPHLTTQPASRTVPTGATVIYAAMAVGNPPLTYQWQINGTNIPGATAAVLSLPNVQPAQAGDYSVVVSNAAGSVTSVVATLTVQVPLGILIAPAFTQAGLFQFNLAGATGSNYVVEASTDLTDWVPLQTNSSPFTFADTNAVNFPWRFYRAQPSP
jgi:alpha-tubulin suppressor-like RCC1 family protein/GH25 family lysozyme M1 (1,4-beta-N-acetylmuramidase)